MHGFYISIHALAKRATLFNDIMSIFFDISIHALAKRATLVSLSLLYCAFVFQSTPSQRGRLALKVEMGSVPNFNPRPRKEGDSKFIQ